MDDKPKGRVTKIEIVSLGIILIFLLLYFLPRVMVGDEKKQNAVLKLSAAQYTSKTLEAFSTAGKKPDAALISKKIADELNQNIKNPIDKKRGVFVMDGPCPGCINVEPDNSMESVIITGYDRNLKIFVRTVIKPPSFVSYTREED